MGKNWFTEQITISDEDREKYFVNFNDKKYVPPFLQTDPVLSQLYKTQGYEIGKINYYIQDIINQAFITTATWGLKYWEEEFGIKTVETDSYEVRRKRLLAKKRGQGVTTKHKLETVAKSFLHEDDSVKVELHNEEYYYKMFLNSEHGFPKEMQDLYDAIEEINPAHLEVQFILRAITKSDLRIVSYGITGEEIRVYPVIINDIVSKAEIPVKFSQDKSIEKISVYPINSVISGVLVTEDDKEIVTEDDNNIKINK